MAARHTPGIHARLKQACVGIAGAGGLGSAVAVALARIGVGRLIIADFDLVEPSNLNRQQYFIDQIGFYKVAALTQNLQRINPYISVEPHQALLGPDNIPQLFAPCSVVVEAFDRADMKAMLVDTVLSCLPGCAWWQHQVWQAMTTTTASPPAGSHQGCIWWVTACRRPDRATA